MRFIKKNKEKETQASDINAKEYIKLTKNIRIFFYIVGAILLIISAVFLFIKARPHMETKDEIINSYNISTDASYKVHLLENSIFDGEFLEEGRLYSSAITDFIRVDFKSELTLTDSLNISGNYSIDAVLQGYQSSNTDEKIVIYEKTYPIKEGAIDNSFINYATITESLDIDRSTYRDYAKDIEAVLGGETEKDFYILFSGKYDVGGEEKEFSYKIDIPVSKDKFYEINKDSIVVDSGDFTEQTTIKVQPKFGSYVVFIALLLVSAGFIAFVRFFTVNMEGKELALKKLSQMMRKYGSRMICIKGIPDLSEKPVINIKSMTEMVELSDEIREAIFYVESENELPKDGKAYILSKDFVYIYDSGIQNEM
ncbi:MAG: hypothetical protein D8H95_15350 [Lachnospiraceae bacterium]|jgi:hypothetical protein|nr:MAG: hypothetical protein D8H95_15350 [Lachnospiraceae bacterium]